VKGGNPSSVYSDLDLNAVKAFGLAFRVDDATVKKYKGFGNALESASGRDPHALPIPAVYIVDSTGKIVFAHSDPDYKHRLEPASIIENLPWSIEVRRFVSDLTEATAEVLYAFAKSHFPTGDTS